MAAKQQLKSSKDSSLQRLISLIIHTVRTGMNAHLCPSLADLWSSGSRLSSFPLPWWSVVTFLTLCKEKEKKRWVTIVLLQQGVMQNCWSKLSSLFNVSTRPAVHLLNMRRAFGSPHVIHIQHDSSAFSRARLLNIFKWRNVNTDAESARGRHEMWQGRGNRQQRSETLFLKVDDLNARS